MLNKIFQGKERKGKERKGKEIIFLIVFSFFLLSATPALAWNPFTAIYNFIFGEPTAIVVPVTPPPVVKTPTPSIPPPTPQQKGEAKVVYVAGSQGLRGLQGIQGPMGLPGPRGPAGLSASPGGSSSSADLSSFVSRSLFDGQVTRIFDSISNSTRGLSDSLAKETITKLLTVSGNATIGGDLTVTGAVTMPGLTTPSLNGLTITSSTGTLTIAALKTLTANNTLIFSGTDGSTLNIGTGGTLGTAAYTASSAYATSVQGTTADNALARAGGTMTGGITNSTSVNPLTTLDESWIGPSSTTGIYFKGGNVGIGVITPSRKLSVRGTTPIISSLDGTTEALFYASGGLARFGSGTASPISFQINGAETIRIDTLGNMGIGNSVPVSPLTIGAATYGGGELTIYSPSATSSYSNQ